jgi:anaerobic magnesium-protoporphyrin IX monomethyl ester cyclase
VACALGVESAAPRVLKLIDKGQPIEVVRDVVDRLAHSDIAVEAMCFTDFPTESGDEALATLRFLTEERSDVALFIVGRFGLTHGARVAQEPAAFGLSEIFSLDGDDLQTGLFFTEKRKAKRPRDHVRVDAALDELSQGYWLRHYPWAGALSTAHTILYYDRFGREVFRRLAEEKVPRDGRGIFGKISQVATARFSLSALDEAEETEQQIWQHLIYEKRQVSRALYEELAGEVPSLMPDSQRYRYAAGETPIPDHRRSRSPLGRRPAPHVPGAYK